MGRAVTHFSLFSGIGGIDLAAEWAGFTTVGQCEWADYPTKVLEKHWPDVPRWRDVRDVTVESIRQRIGGGTVTLVSGGFPCQPFSVAGKQKGKRDDRYLWPEMLRVIRKIKPSWVLGENVPGILQIAGKTVCEDLEREGYAVTVFNFEAAAVGAKHRRERIFFVGHSKHNGLLAPAFTGSFNKAGYNDQERQNKASELKGAGRPGGYAVVADTDKQGLQAQWIERGIQEEKGETCSSSKRRGLLGEEWYTAGWESEPNVGRVANGIPGILDGGGLNKKLYSQETGSKEYRGQGMREMRVNQESTETSSRYIKASGSSDIMSKMSCGSRSGARQMGQGKQAETDLCNLRQGIHAEMFPQTQNMQSGVLKGTWTDKRIKEMAEIWLKEPNIPRVANGIKNRVDRLKCLGNAVVPWQVYPILKAIYEIEANIS